MPRSQVNELRLLALILTGASVLAGCSAMSDMVTPAKVDYRTAAVKAQPLEVPPDLTQLSGDPRYQPAAGVVVSAAAIQAATATAPKTTLAATTPATTANTAVVAPVSSGAVRIERAGSQRWLVVSQSPEQLWPQLRNFWPAAGFTLISDKPEIGVMETDWAENRAKLPQDIVRRTIGRIADGMFDSGQRDRFHLRVERSTSSNSTEIYLSHRAATEITVTATGGRSDATRWQLSPSDPQVEAEMLGRLMLFLAPPGQVAATQGADQAALAAAASAVAKAPDAPARARLLDGRPAATLQVDDDFSRAWRRVGLALDRNGFTVEDRDRGQGLYFVRYVDPKLAGKEEPGFFARIFSGAKKEDYSGTRYRVGVQAEGKASVVAVFDSQGAPQNSESARNIVQLLLAELR
jgi:outer membrane protein assembly factor BamC